MLKMSHIILYADKVELNDAICAFCTNIYAECGYNIVKDYSYVNRAGAKNMEHNGECIGQLKEYLTGMTREEVKSILVITDNKECCELMEELSVAFCVLLTKANKDEDFSGVKYLVSELEYIDFAKLNRIWQRYYRIPWVIGEDDAILLREHTLSDVDAIYEIYSDPLATRFMDGLHDNREDEETYIRDYIDNQYSFCEYGIWAVIEKSSGKIIGRAGLSTRPQLEDIELGYVIAREYRNKGYAKRACKIALKYAKDELGIEKVVAVTNPHNDASIKVLSGMGFAWEQDVIIDSVSCNVYGIKL